MKTNSPFIQRARGVMPYASRIKVYAVVLFFSLPLVTSAQAVTEIVTNYNGYWKTSASSMSSTKPDNHHELISFSYNGTRYSTGVNDALLTSHSLTFSP